LPCTRTSPNPGDEFMLSMRPFELQAPATIFSPGRKLLWNTRTESIHGDVGAFAKYRDRGSERAAVECRWDVSSLRDPVMSGTLPQAQCSRPGQKRGGKVGYPTAVVPSRPVSRSWSPTQQTRIGMDCGNGGNTRPRHGSSGNT
jgi:hypothetical protein